MPYSRVLRAFGLPAAQLLLLSALAPSSGLGSPVFPQSCDCGELFTFVVETVEANYPGYQDLIQSGAGSWLEGRTVELERKARAVETADCAVVLHEWVRLFGDLHLSVHANDQFTWSDRVPTTGGGALRIKILDDESILLRVPSFAVSQRQAIDSLLSEHWSSITRRRSLIIDLRRNPGGTDASFRELLPLVYTDPITVGLGALWASPANVALWKSFVTNPAQIQQMEEGLGGFVTFEPSLITYDETLAMPERVAILVDRYTASSAEGFILQALYGSKTLVFGRENTAGAIDYLNVTAVELPCEGETMLLAFPTSKRVASLPDGALNHTGITPDVLIPDDTSDPVEFVRNYLSSVRPPRR